MLAALTLAATLATPTPTPPPTALPSSPATALPIPTPPPEPNHVTITGIESYVQGWQQEWARWSGVTSQISGLYEFQAGPNLRFSDSLHWERLSSHFTYYYDDKALPFQFNYNECDDEFDIETGRPDYPTGIGVGYFDYNPVYDSGYVYPLAGFGIGVDRWPNWYVPRSFYYSIWYYPDAKGSEVEAGAYAIVRVDLGLNIRKSLVSPWGLRIGVQDESWFAKNADAYTKNFLAPYLSLTYWH